MFIFYDNYNLTTRHGIINELFPGVASDENCAFRYKNRMLSFFQKKENKAISYDYHEFSNNVNKSWFI
jgi:hypothetical protein